MDALELASRLWCVGPWLVIGAIVLFGIPALKFILHPLPTSGRFFMYLNLPFGILEKYISPIRITLAFLYLCGGIAWQAYISIAGEDYPSLVYCLYGALLIALIFINMRLKKNLRIRLAQSVALHPDIHPKEFFNYYMGCAGIFNNAFKGAPHRTVDLKDLNFTGRARGQYISKRSLFSGAMATFRLARLAAAVGKRLGRDALFDIAPAIASVWASKIAMTISARVTLEDDGNAAGVSGPSIFLFTHKSFLDFIFAPLAALSINMANGRRRIPLFLVAKNHFRKNPILYRIFGIGMAAEAMGMIFVDRDDCGDKGRAKAVSDAASDLIVKDGLDLALFPQGTRVTPYQPLAGARIDAGYYTAGSKKRLKADGKHLKMGAAYIAADSVIKLNGEKSISIIPIAIQGTATACPKGSCKAQPNVHIRLVVGETVDPLHPALEEGLLKLMPDDENAYTSFAKIINQGLDASLRHASKVDGDLEQRYFRDIRDMFEPLVLDEISVAMKQWRGDDALVHAILDCTYTCKQQRWRPFLGELSHLLTNFAERDEFMKLKSRIVDVMPV
jgi:1-acyl-sn-glycerol-3-phosphate acyltransferase